MAKGASSSAEVRGLVIHDIKEVEGVSRKSRKIREMKRWEMKSMERSKRSLTVRMKHEDDFGVNKTQT